MNVIECRSDFPLSNSSQPLFFLVRVLCTGTPHIHIQSSLIQNALTMILMKRKAKQQKTVQIKMYLNVI